MVNLKFHFVCRKFKYRTDYVWKRGRTKTQKSPCPVNVTIAKGAVHVLAHRDFVGYVVNDPRAHQFREWLKDTRIPDETFFNSLIVSPQLGVPGAIAGRFHYEFSLVLVFKELALYT